MAKIFKGIKNGRDTQKSGEQRKQEASHQEVCINMEDIQSQEELGDETSVAAISREQAKVALERRIAEKLAQMSETDLEELFLMHEQQRKANKDREKSITPRSGESLEGQIAFETIKEDESTALMIELESASEPESVPLMSDIRLKAITEIENLTTDIDIDTDTDTDIDIMPYPTTEFEAELEPDTPPELASAIESADMESVENLIIEPDTRTAADLELEKRVEEFYKNYDVFEGEAEFGSDGDERGIPFVEVVSAYGQKAKNQMGKKLDRARKGVVSFKMTIVSRAGKIPTLIAEKKQQTNRPPSPRQRTAKYIFLRFKRRFVRNEKKASSSMAEFIIKMDQRNDMLAEKTTEIVVRSNRHFNFAREWSEMHKRGLLMSLMIIVALAIGATGFVNALSAYEYAYNGRVLGMVKNQEDVLKILSVISKELTQEYGTAIEIDKDQDITFSRIWAIGKDIDDMQDVLNRLTYMQNMNAKAYALYIDGRRIGIVDTETRAQLILQSVKDLYMGSGDNANVAFEQVSFAEQVEVRQIDTQLGRIQNPEDVEKRILTGAVEEKVHIVKKGETFSEIARKYGMTQDELLGANPGITPAKLNIDQQIVLTQSVPLVTVQTVEVATYIEPIPYETIYEDNAGIFKGETSTKVKGVNGEREVTARITKNNGIEVAKTELSVTILSEASSAVVMVGTKDPPPLQGSGKFIYPVNGARLTSKFGMRSGRMHYGIDLACSTGTRISASDGGTVTFSGYSGSYGYVVKIDHGRNYETVYAHCSKLFVKKGDKVYQGQHIANVGNTGRSTGPHCHFEVKVNGVAKNPLNYL